ncbi:MAG TPA: hypothetical protein VFP69_13715 [Streptomyces sp.]|nr:hypothetical protein [Streptomyces sp.]
MNPGRVRPAGRACSRGSRFALEPPGLFGDGTTRFGCGAGSAGVRRPAKALGHIAQIDKILWETKKA